MVKKTMVAVAALLAAVFAFAQDAEIVKVKGRGVGVDKTEALKDAYRDAVERAVGLYVDAEQMMKNEELVKDQILTQSNAYIEKYEVAKEATKPNGLVEVQILAEVRKAALTKKIFDVMPAKTFQLNSSVTKNLHAQLVTEEKRSVDGAALVKNALDGLDPVRQLVKASLVSPEPEIVSNNGGGRRKDGDFVTLRYTLKFEIDRERYMNDFLPHLQNTMEQISTTPPKMIRLSSIQRRKRVDRSANDVIGFIGLRNLVGEVDGEKIEIGRLVLSGGTKYWGRRVVVIVTDVNATATCGKAAVCNIDDVCADAISKWCRRPGYNAVQYNVVLSSKSGSDICVTPVKVFGLNPVAFNGMPKYGAGRGYLAITPFVGCCAEAYYLKVECIVPKDELPNVDSITIELAD